jgi:ornithine cyclodeaminase
VAPKERIVGFKVGSYWPNNHAVGLAPHGSSIFLLSPDTGRLMAIVDASHVNGPRTAAADAVAAHLLAKPTAQTLTLIGAGHQAEHEAHALCAIRPIRRILIVSRSSARAALLRDGLTARLGIDVETVGVEQGCREADILVTVTSSRAPLFDASWVRPGTHVASMGSDQAGKQELPPSLLHRARLFCDLPSQAIEIGEFQHVKKEIQSRALAVTAVGDLLLSRAGGRSSPDDITVFDSSGLALQDLFVATSLLQAKG